MFHFVQVGHSYSCIWKVEAHYQLKWKHFDRAGTALGMELLDAGQSFIHHCGADWHINNY